MAFLLNSKSHTRFLLLKDHCVLLNSPTPLINHGQLKHFSTKVKEDQTLVDQVELNDNKVK